MQEWAQDCSKQQRLAQDTLRLIQEQNDASDLGLDVESDSAVIAGNLDRLRKAKYELEKRLSKAEENLEQ